MMKHRVKNYIVVLALGLVVGLVPSCRSSQHNHDAEQAQEQEHTHDHDHAHCHGHDHAHHHHGANVVQFSHEQAHQVGLQMEQVRPRRFGQVIRTSAQVLTAQGDAQQATAPAAGMVRFANPHLAEGTAVKAGQVLFRIESSGLADGNMGVRFRETESRYRAAKSAYERKQRLAEDRIVSAAELEQSRVEFEVAEAAYENLKAHFSEAGGEVKAPITGYVQRIEVHGGDFVEAGQVLATVSQTRDLQLRAEVSPRYYKYLKHIKGMNVELPCEGRTYSLEELQGSLLSYGRSTDTKCPLIPVTFRIRNVADLPCGTFVSAYLITEADGEQLTVDNEAIVEEMGSYFVFVEVEEDEYEKRPVTIGETDGRRTVIRTGLESGEWVVTHGARLVRLAQGSAALDPHAGHVH